MNKIRSYPKILALGHARLPKLVGEVLVQEKYDGSQLSWQWFDGELFVKSKGKMQAGGGVTPDKMFDKAIAYLESVSPIGNRIFRGEYFTKPKHNTLEYDRIPRNGIIVYDAEIADQESRYVDPVTVAGYADRLGLEYAWTFWCSDIASLTNEKLNSFLEEDSSLGGVKVEGVVIKSYRQFTEDGKVAMAKYVSEKFKETHDKSWKERNPGQGDVIQKLLNTLNTEARFLKAVQWMRDNGELTVTPADIGPLMKRVKQDTLEEEREYITNFIVGHFSNQVSRGLGRGLPEWYKWLLAEQAMGGSE